MPWKLFFIVQVVSRPGVGAIIFEAREKLGPVIYTATIKLVNHIEDYTHPGEVYLVALSKILDELEALNVVL